MDLKLTDKVALVTGGTHGVGLSVALALGREGCRVAVCSRTQERIEEALKLLKKENIPCRGVRCDVTVASDIARAVKETADAWGTIHILVNNVGGGGRWGQEIVEETAEDVWKDVYEKNVSS